MDKKEKKTVSVTIDKLLYEEIKEYCNLNDLNVREYIQRKLVKGLAEDQWGDAPFYRKSKEQSTKKEPAVFTPYKLPYYEQSEPVSSITEKSNECETEPKQPEEQKTEKKTTRRKLK